MSYRLENPTKIKVKNPLYEETPTLGAGCGGWHATDPDVLVETGWLFASPQADNSHLSMRKWSNAYMSPPPLFKCSNFRLLIYSYQWAHWLGGNSCEKVETFNYLGSFLTNLNYIHEDIKCKLKTGNWYYSIQSLLSSRLLSRNLKVI